MAAEYFLEKRKLPTQAAMSADIARHLQVRQRVGRAVVVTTRSSILLSTVRRQWVKITHSLQRECARTLDTTLKAELSRQLKAMQELRFVARSPQKDPDADVYFLEASEVEGLPEDCRTVYLCADKTQLEAIKEYITPECVVVKYCQEQS